MFNRKNQRKCTGSLVEFTAIIPVFFMFIMIPMADLATAGLRTTFITVAARDAVHVAAKARSFEAELNGEPSAETRAKTVAISRAQSFGGVRVLDVKTRIVTVDINDANNVQRYETKLPANPEPDTKKFVYQLEVEVHGEASPLMPMGGVFQYIPGLSKPLPFVSVAREVFEDPSALTL